MIVIIGGGRLGNQIFQYAFLKNIETDKTVILGVNLENLQKIFDIEDKLILVPNKR